jgi:hypothetical protein
MMLTANCHKVVFSATKWYFLPFSKFLCQPKNRIFSMGWRKTGIGTVHAQAKD